MSPPSHPIAGVATSVAGFVGIASAGSTAAVAIGSFAEFETAFGNWITGFLSYAVKGFFDNGGNQCFVATITSAQAIDDGLSALASENISILACPDEHQLADAAAKITAHCEERKDRFAILQSPPVAPTVASHHPPVDSSYAAYYYPWLHVTSFDGSTLVAVPPCGHLAGVYALTDSENGVFKAPAGRAIAGVQGLSQTLTESDAGILNGRGIDTLRVFPGRGSLVWGGRTTSSDPEWKYVNIRRLFIYIEQSIQQGLQWTVFEPSAPPVWQMATVAVQSFLADLWRSGGLVGAKADEAFFVRCDRTTMTQDDIDNGRLVMLVGVAAVKPAEFVIFQIGI
jgi:uncharacterized protein